MIPLFKSHYSVGNSILTLDSRESIGGPSSIFSLIDDELVLVEDTMASFRRANTYCMENNIKLRFGLRINVIENQDDLPSKLIFFARNNNGVAKLRELLYNSTEHDNVVYLPEVKITDDVQVCVPFYDSFIFNSLFYFGLHSIQIKKFNPVFFLEDNLLPFDALCRERVLDYAKDIGKTELVKSIYYKNREDFKQFQFYKEITKRKQGGKPPRFSHPTHRLSSAEFCWEAYNEYKHR